MLSNAQVQKLVNLIFGLCVVPETAGVIHKTVKVRLGEYNELCRWAGNVIHHRAENRLILVRLDNGDTAVFLNADLIASLEGCVSSELTPQDVAENLSKALGLDLEHIALHVPKEEDRDWTVVFKSIPARKAASPLQDQQ